MIPQRLHSWKCHNFASVKVAKSRCLSAFLFGGLPQQNMVLLSLSRGLRTIARILGVLISDQPGRPLPGGGGPWFAVGAISEAGPS